MQFLFGAKVEGHDGEPMSPQELKRRQAERERRMDEIRAVLEPLEVDRR